MSSNSNNETSNNSNIASQNSMNQGNSNTGNLDSRVNKSAHKKKDDFELRKTFARFGIIVIILIICIMIHGMLHGNGRLSMAMIFVLVFISIVYWAVSRLIKRAEDYKESLLKKERQKEMNDIARMKTKNV